MVKTNKKKAAQGVWQKEKIVTEKVVKIAKLTSPIQSLQAKKRKIHKVGRDAQARTKILSEGVTRVFQGTRRGGRKRV